MDKKRRSKVLRKSTESMQQEVREAPSLSSFPAELIVHILKFVDVCYTSHVASVCKLWHQCIQSPTYWKDKCELKWGKRPPSFSYDVPELLLLPPLPSTSDADSKESWLVYINFRECYDRTRKATEGTSIIINKKHVKCEVSRIPTLKSCENLLTKCTFTVKNEHAPLNHKLQCFEFRAWLYTRIAHALALAWERNPFPKRGDDFEDSDELDDIAANAEKLLLILKEGLEFNEFNAYTVDEVKYKMSDVGTLAKSLNRCYNLLLQGIKYCSGDVLLNYDLLFVAMNLATQPGSNISAVLDAAGAKSKTWPGYLLVTEVIRRIVASKPPNDELEIVASCIKDFLMALDSSTRWWFMHELIADIDNDTFTTKEKARTRVKYLLLSTRNQIWVRPKDRVEVQLAKCWDEMYVLGLFRDSCPDVYVAAVRTFSNSMEIVDINKAVEVICQCAHEPWRRREALTALSELIDSDNTRKGALKAIQQHLPKTVAKLIVVDIDDAMEAWEQLDEHV